MTIATSLTGLWRSVMPAPIAATASPASPPSLPVQPPPPAPSPAASPPDRFPVCLPWILAREGGYSDLAADRGGATNKGITQATLARWRHAPVTAEDVRGLTDAEAGAIYRAEFWGVAGCGGWPAGVDLSVFDAAVMSGPGRAVMFLQAAVGVAADGAPGPMTRLAVKGMPAKDLVAALAEARAGFYRAIVERDQSQGVFLKGWLARVEATRARALADAG